MNNKILVIAAHPDDEVLGCGGTIARHTSERDNVGVVFVSDGVGARLNNFEQSLVQRKKAASKALAVIGAQCLGFFDFPDNQLDTIPLINIVQKLESVIKKFNPRLVYTHHYGDLNIDHKIVHRATMTACRPLPGNTIKEICSYEVLSSTEWSLTGETFIPNHFVDIDSFFTKKIAALKAYSEEIRKFPHTRSIENVKALAIHRGATVGLRKAESFHIIRRLV